jgi:two-component system response regulator RegA
MGEGPRPLVLVVDDDEDHVTMLELGLAGAGFSVITACSCAEARHLLGAHAVDALIADLTLGDGTSLSLLDGLARRPRVAVVLSGFDAPEDIARTKAAGYDAHIVKPASFSDLARVIRDGLERTSSGVRLAKASPRPSDAADTKRSTG